MDFNSIVNLNEFPLTVKWRITNCCNYNCSYCLRKNKRDNIENYKRDEQTVINTIPKLAKIIREKNVDTKIELIGGEVSLFNLEDIIERLYNEIPNNLKRISFISNLSKSAEYYNDLIDVCTKHNIELSIVASFHYEFTTLDNFFEKIKKLNFNDHFLFKVEMVSTRNNLEQVNELIKRCEENNIIYLIDADCNETDISGLIVETSENKKDEYKISYDDHTEYCKSLRGLVKKYGDYKTIPLRGYLCTLDYDYFRVDYDYHIGFVDGMKGCKNAEPLEAFRLNKYPSYCHKGCSLCGAMSVFKDYEEFTKNYNKQGGVHGEKQTN
jgi:organic radical activating enzyme